MKRSLSSLIIFFLALGGISAQCTMQIFPVPGHIKIISNQSVAATGTVYWICDGVDVIVTSSPGSLFLLEAGATITFNGSSGDAVYAKAGCVITNNTIEDIGVVINPANVTLNNNSSGSITITTSCTNVIYDYSMVGGSSGCATGISEINTPEITVFPIPAIDNLHFSVPFSGTLIMYRGDGALIEQKEVSNLEHLEIQHLPQGVYFLRLGDQSLRFIK